MRGLLLITLMIFSLSYPNISNAEWKLYECDSGMEDVYGNPIKTPCWKFYPPGD